MDEKAKDVPKRSPRPPSNWAQLVSAGTSLVTVALALYALFFSSASQALVQYLQSELVYRNKVISNLSDTKEGLEKSISAKEIEFRDLNKKSRELQAAIDALTGEKLDAETQIKALKEEQSALSRDVAEARVRSQNNEFSYIKEYLAGRSEASPVVTWPMTMDYDRKRTTVRRETIWPQYLDFYRKAAASFPEPQRSGAEHVVSLFERQCARFENTVFEIPVPTKMPDIFLFLRMWDPAIERVREKAKSTIAGIVSCMRGVQDE